MNKEAITIGLACLGLLLAFIALVVSMRNTYRVAKAKRLFLQAVGYNDRERARVLLESRTESDKQARELIRDISSKLPQELVRIPDYWNLDRVLGWILRGD